MFRQLLLCGHYFKFRPKSNGAQCWKYPDAYTCSRRPVELVWYQDFTEPNQAIYFEKKIKKWSRAKKEAIINDDWDLLPLLSECKNETHSKNNESRFPFDSAQDRLLDLTK